MTNDRWTIPNLGSAPEEYNRAYFNSLIRQLEVLLASMKSVGEIEGATLLLQNLPTSPSGLSVGQVYLDGAILKIVTQGIVVHPDTELQLQTAVGTVTVSTP